MPPIPNLSFTGGAGGDAKSAATGGNNIVSFSAGIQRLPSVGTLAVIGLVILLALFLWKKK